MANATPAWRNNILACYPAILKRLEQVTQVKKVLEAQDFSAISSERRQRPLDGAVYVILDGFTPTSTNDNNRGQTIEIGFSIILTKTNYTPRPQTDGVGETLTAIAKALQGFDPSDESERALTTTPFKQRTALPIRYEDGFAFFPLRFTAEIAVIADND